MYSLGAFLVLVNAGRKATLFVSVLSMTSKSESEVSVWGTENAIKVCSERKEETEHKLSSSLFKFTHLKHVLFDK